MTNSTTTSNKPWPALVPSNSSSSARLIAKLIRVYQNLTAGRAAPCRFYPSCSHYAHEAVLTHGALRGTLLAVRRVSRCRPLGPHGVDLVPTPKESRNAKS